jgi:hypothetical protein
MPVRKDHIIPKIGKTFTRKCGGIKYTLEILIAIMALDIKLGIIYFALLLRRQNRLLITR